MPKYTYVSRNTQGQRVTAIAEAPNRQELLGQLKDRGLTVVEVKELDGRAQTISGRRARMSLSRVSFERISTGEMSIFWRELATMVAAGLPIVDALESIAQEMEHVKLRHILNDVTVSMWEGFNFSQSIGRHPRVFSPMVIALIGAAEESGSLPEVANQLADFLEKRDRLMRKVRAALTYPVFLASFFLIVMAVATFVIIPKFREIYEGFGARLPWLTNATFAINELILNYFPWLVAGTVLLVVAVAMWVRRPSGRAAMDRLILGLPIFGKLLQRSSVSRFCRSLSILLSGGIPINRAMEMAEGTSGNTVVARAIAESRESILKGGKIAASLKKHQIFPQMAIRMISAGEETGSLSSLLEKVADFYETRVDAALTTINTLIEPVMIVLIGGFVLLFVLALYMPIFSLAATMRG